MRLPTSRCNGRRGTIFVEALIAITIILVTMGAVAQVVAISIRQRREVEQIRVATQEAANVMERAFGLPWNELNEQTAASIAISHSATESLDEPRLQVSIETMNDSIPAKRIVVRISWVNRAGERVEPIQLISWQHSSEVGP